MQTKQRSHSRPMNPRGTDHWELSPREIAEILGESEQEPLQLIPRIRAVLGPKVVRQFLDKTLQIEANGGLLVRNGSRRRTRGGVFFHIAKCRCRGLAYQRILCGLELPRKSNAKQSPMARSPHTGEAQMPATLVFRPAQWTNHNDYIMTTCTVSAPKNLPRELPVVEPGQSNTWVVVIGIRQWRRVVDVFRAVVDDKLILQGTPMSCNRQLILMATSVQSVFVERQRQEAQRAASPGAVAS
jgi:hypothetical protein